MDLSEFRSIGAIWFRLVNVLRWPELTIPGKLYAKRERGVVSP